MKNRLVVAKGRGVGSVSGKGNVGERDKKVQISNNEINKSLR